MNTVPGPFAALQLARLRQAAEGVQDGALERDQLRAEATALQEEVSGCLLLLLSVVPVVSPARRTATPVAQIYTGYHSCFSLPFSILGGLAPAHDARDALPV